MIILFAIFKIIDSRRTTIEFNILPLDSEIYINGTQIINKKTSLQPGTYEIRISRPGFSDYNQSTIINRGPNNINTILVPNSEMGRVIEKNYNQKQVKKIQNLGVKSQAEYERSVSKTTHTGDDTKIEIHAPESNITDEKDIIYYNFPDYNEFKGFIENLQIFLVKNGYKNNEPITVEGVRKDTKYEPYPFYIKARITKDNKDLEFRIEYDQLNTVMYFVHEETGYKSKLVLDL